MENINLNSDNKEILWQGKPGIIINSLKSRLITFIQLPISIFLIYYLGIPIISIISIVLLYISSCIATYYYIRELRELKNTTYRLTEKTLIIFIPNLSKDNYQIFPSQLINIQERKIVINLINLDRFEINTKDNLWDYHFYFKFEGENNFSIKMVKISDYLNLFKTLKNIFNKFGNSFELQATRESIDVNIKK